MTLWMVISKFTKKNCITIFITKYLFFFFNFSYLDLNPKGKIEEKKNADPDLQPWFFSIVLPITFMAWAMAFCDLSVWILSETAWMFARISMNFLT